MRRGLVAALIILLAGAAPALAQETKTLDLTVLTYNVEGLPWPVRTGRGKKLKAIGRQLAQLRTEGREPDVVLLQEGFIDEAADLIALSGYPYVAKGPDKRQRDGNVLGKDRLRFRRIKYPQRGEGMGKWRGSGLYILSDHPIVTETSHAYRFCAGLDCLANNGVLMVGVQPPGAPTVIEVANTHMNANGAARVPRRRTQTAHHLQADELKRFLLDARTPGAPLIVGGDFNVKHSAVRYDYVLGDYPFIVTSQYCKLNVGACEAKISFDGDAPWLDTQDLIAASDGAGVTVRPVQVEALFDGREGPALSDHDAYQVRFRLTWKAHLGTMAARPPLESPASTSGNARPPPAS